MNLHVVPVELVELLKHADVEGKKLTWNLQVNVIAVTVNLIWIKAENPIATNGEVTSQTPKKKHPSASTRKRNAQRLNQWKAKRNQAVVNIKVHAEVQTDNLNTQIDDTTQTDQQSSQDLDHNTPPRVLQKRERPTQSRNHIKGRPLTPTKYRNEEQSQKPWKRCTSVRSLYMPDLICHKTEFIDRTMFYSEAFDPDDTTLMDRYPRYDIDKLLGDRPPTPIQQREVRYNVRASRKTEHASMKSNLSVKPDEDKPDVKHK
jgi:hypothetical protein